MIIHMELEEGEGRIIGTTQFMKVKWKMIKRMDEEHVNTDTRKMFMRVNGKIMNLMDLEFTHLKT